MKEPGAGAVVTFWGRLFHSGMVLGKKAICLYAVQWDRML